MGGVFCAGKTASVSTAAIERALPPVHPADGHTPDSSRRAVQTALEIGAAVWLAGVFALLLYGAVGYLCLQKRVATAIRVRSNIYESDRIQTPFVLGVIRPKIYVPAGFDRAPQWTRGVGGRR